MDPSKIERISDEADPHRCQAIRRGSSQCINKAVPGGKYCLMHGGAAEQNQAKASELRNYRIAKFRVEIAEKANCSDIKSLRDEVGILRYILEEQINACQNASELLLSSGPIADLVSRVERTVLACHKLEQSMGRLLDEEQVLQFADEVIKIIQEELSESPEVIARLTAAIIKATTRNREEITLETEL